MAMQVKISVDSHEAAVKQLMSALGNPNGRPGQAVSFLIERYAQLAIQQLTSGQSLPSMAVSSTRVASQPTSLPKLEKLPEPAKAEQSEMKNSDILSSLFA